jgi:hypothetical protein
MGWLIDRIESVIWGVINSLTRSAFDVGYGFLITNVTQSNDINRHLNVDQFLIYIQILAGTLLAFKIAKTGLGYLTGAFDFDSNSFDLSNFVLGCFSACAGIVILPFIFTEFLLKINNLLIQGCQDIGLTYHQTIDTAFFIDKSAGAVGVLAIGFLIMGVAFLVLAVIDSIRYFELIFCYLYAPIASASFIGKGEGVQVWWRESIAVIFTQSFHFFMLQLLLLTIRNATGFWVILLPIGNIVVMLKGSKMLRQFLYSSGTGAAAVGSVGAVGRMGAMRIMMKGIGK